jgi:hypothetical protein
MALTTARQYHIDPTVVRRAEELLVDFELHCRPPSELLTPNVTNDAATDVDFVAGKEFTAKNRLLDKTTLSGQCTLFESPNMFVCVFV